jgi:chromosome segregation ATPase
VEQELRAKSEQIAKLQAYMKEEISNIQAIVTESNALKKENEVLRTALANKSRQLEESNKEVQMLTQLNKESSTIIQRLEEQIQEMEPAKHPSIPSLQENSSQTDPVANAVPSLLDKIASLEELVMQLKF